MGADTGTSSPASLVVRGWPRTLTWDDFRELDGRPADAEGDENAQISSEIRQPDRISVVREGGTRRVTSLDVEIRVDRTNTWVVRSQKTDTLLGHEQGHYDITGLMGRDMGNEILAARAPSAEALQQVVSEIIQRYRDRARALTRQYDTDTNHGRNREAQQRWDQRIRSCMDNGTPFTAP